MGSDLAVTTAGKAQHEPTMDSERRSRRHNYSCRRDILCWSGHRCLLLVLLVLSAALRTGAFVPTASTSTSTAPTGTNRHHPPLIDPSQQPSCSSSSALGAFFGGPNNNNSNNEKKNEDVSREDEWWKDNLFLRAIKSVFTQRNEFLDSIRESLGTQQPSDSDGNQGTEDNMKSEQKQPQQLASQFFEPPGIKGTFNSIGNIDALNFNDVHDLDNDDEDAHEEEEDDELPAGTTLLFKIPAKQLKPGGLRLFLMFYLMGMQNTPDRNTWRADQRLMSVNVTPKGFGDDDASSAEEEKTYVLEMLYDKDRSGMLQIELLPERPRKKAEIRIYRCGSRPSTSYLMQESVIVDGVLDELQNISGEKDNTQTIPPSDSDPNEEVIADENRLIITDPPNAIEAARESLAFS